MDTDGARLVAQWDVTEGNRRVQDDMQVLP